MRRAAEILKELGFNSHSSPSVQNAFVRHLKASAAALSAQNISANTKPELSEQQLSFDPEILGSHQKPIRVVSGQK